MIRYRLLGLTLSALGCFSACQPPCMALAERICSCEPDQQSRQLCRNQVQSLDQYRDPTLEDEQACSAALETCTCAQLLQNQVEFCGFTRGDSTATEGTEAP